MKKLFGSLLLVSVLLLTLVPLAVAQEDVVAVPTEGQTILYVVGAWLLYSLLGMVTSLTSVDAKGNPIGFDTPKLLKSLLWAGAVAVIALLGNIHPTIVEAEYSNLVTEIVNAFMNTGGFLTLIYSFDKLGAIVSNLAAKLKATAEAKT